MGAIFDGSEGNTISKAQAEYWTENFRAANDPGVIKAQYIGGDIIKTILAQTDCVGIRMYNAITSATPGKPQLVIVGVTADGVDMTDGTIADGTIPCPTTCDTTSVLY